MGELKLCPFCGGKAKLTVNYFGGVSYGVSCTNCGASSASADAGWDSDEVAKKNAINAWNRRETLKEE